VGCKGSVRVAYATTAQIECVVVSTNIEKEMGSHHRHQRKQQEDDDYDYGRCRSSSSSSSEHANE
jgi:hypothetical protein